MEMGNVRFPLPRMSQTDDRPPLRVCAVHPNLPLWTDVTSKLTDIGTQINLPRHLQWWRYKCNLETGTSRGCKLHDCLGDFTCLNTIMAEVPSSVANWCTRSADRFVKEKGILKIQIEIAEYVTKRREILYPKNYHPT